MFLDPKTLEFTVNDTVFDPHIESSVIYNGAGQIINNSEVLMLKSNSTVIIRVAIIILFHFQQQE